MLFLDGGVLPHQRGGRLGHLLRVRGRIITKAAAVPLGVDHDLLGWQLTQARRGCFP